MKNDYEVRGDVTAIFIKSPKYGNFETLISTAKLPKALEFYGKWSVIWSKETNSFYVQGNTPIKNGGHKTTIFHRWLLDAPKGMDVDHINHNTLDNTDSNLRVVTRQQNLQNKRTSDHENASGIRGVVWLNGRKRWRAQAMVNYKFYNLGYYMNKDDAANVVHEFRKVNMPFSLDALEE